MKRLSDIIVSVLLLVFFSPILLLVIILIRVKLGLPVMFNHVRPGLHGVPFRMFKFRTMTDERGSDGELLTDADRLNRTGALLRSTSLDEFPALINVLKGEMSLVGPRPLLVEYLPLYSKEHLRRHEVKPGLTGLAQVNGRNQLEWEEKLFLDIKYVEQVSIWLDIKIIVQTVFQVLKSKDIDHHGEIMTKFEGSKDK